MTGQERRQKEWEEWRIANLPQFRKYWKPPPFAIQVQTEPSKLLPVFTDESLHAIEVRSSDGSKLYIVNLLEYTCTCEQCFEIHSWVPARDFGRICKHIVIALRMKKLVPQLPPIAKGIAGNGYPKAFGVYPGHFAIDGYSNPVYITGRDFYGWVSVFALSKRNGVNYYRFGFNVNSKEWYYPPFGDGCPRGYLSNPRRPQIDESFLY